MTAENTTRTAPEGLTALDMARNLVRYVDAYARRAQESEAARRAGDHGPHLEDEIAQIGTTAYHDAIKAGALAQVSQAEDLQAIRGSLSVLPVIAEHLVAMMGATSAPVTSSADAQLAQVIRTHRTAILERLEAHGDDHLAAEIRRLTVPDHG
jgi:hypothetical protein